MRGLFDQVNGGRTCERGVNGAVGRDLDNLLAVAPVGRISQEEGRRIILIHARNPNAIWCRYCPWHFRNGYCTQGRDCPSWHVDPVEER